MIRIIDCGSQLTHNIARRAAVTWDFMTADIYEFPWKDLGRTTGRIVNEVKGVNRVLYDMTQKPPATFEFEYVHATGLDTSLPQVGVRSAGLPHHSSINVLRAAPSPYSDNE